MTVNVKIYDHSAVIVMTGQFDFHVHRDFTDAYTQLFDNAAIREIEIEMSGVSYIDSSALGMLLLLHYRAIAVKKPVVLLNLTGTVLRVLETAHFGGLFDIRRSA